jgi:hypothetical protein
MLKNWKHKLYFYIGAIVLVYVLAFVFFFNGTIGKIMQVYQSKNDQSKSTYEKAILEKQKMILQLDSNMQSQSFFNENTDIFSFISAYAKQKKCTITEVPKNELPTEASKTKIIIEGNFFSLFDLLKAAESRSTAVIHLYNTRFFTKKKFTDKTEKLYLELNFTKTE